MKTTCLILACLFVVALSAQPALGQLGGMENNPFGSVFGDDFFDKVQAELIEFSTAGDFKLTGSVKFESPQLSLYCTRLYGHADDKKFRAEGGPVKIHQGDAIRAECKKFTYHTDTKTSVLEGKPIIFQKGDGKTTKASGDKITISQNGEGDTSIVIEMNPNSKRKPTIEMVEEIKKVEEIPGMSEKDQPKKVDKKNMELLKLPEPNI